MNKNDVYQFVMTYLEATDCHIVEKTPKTVTVRLSPEADKDLTNRHYYWSFVERTGAEPQTMTMTFDFDPEAEEAKRSPAATAAASVQANAPTNGDSILGRYFGFAPAPPAATRTPRDEVTYGSRRLEQLFGVVRTKGRFVQMYEDVEGSFGTTPVEYHTWLCVNYKLEFCCDMKRDELHSLGISLVTGELIENFQERLSRLSLTPRLPAHSHSLVRRPLWSVQQAIGATEQFLEQEIRGYSHDWAKGAYERLEDELARVDAYYGELLQTVEPEKKDEVEAQYVARKREIEWQYRPRIETTVVNAGLFHLHVDTLSSR